MPASVGKICNCVENKSIYHRLMLVMEQRYITTRCGESLLSLDLNKPVAEKSHPEVLLAGMLRDVFAETVGEKMHGACQQCCLCVQGNNSLFGSLPRSHTIYETGNSEDEGSTWLVAKACSELRGVEQHMLCAFTTDNQVDHHFYS